MLRQRSAVTFIFGLSAWLAVVLLAMATLLSFTDQVSAQQGVTASTLSAPTLTAQATENGINLRWSEVTGATRYELYAWTEAAGWWEIGGDNLTGSSFTHSDVTAGTTYYYTVRAVNADGDESDWATNASVTLGTPALSTPILTAQATASGINLGWNEVTGAARYELYAWTEAAGWWEIGGDNLTGSSFTHSDVTAGTTYYYTVRAVNADGDESDWATNASATALQQHIATVTPTPTETATSTPTPTATADVSGVSDRDALVALYNATHGDNWASNANWLSQEAIGDWYGVTTDANGSVTRLMLPSNHLSGTIPAALGSLGKLEQLYLYGNSLTGRIPAELGNLGSLTILQLQVNQLSGPIPKELGNPAGLIALHLNYNKLSGMIPGELGDLGNLVRLHLNNNALSGSIPVELGNLRNLAYLTLKANQLSGCVPSALGDVANNDLGDLGLSFCTGIPATSTPTATATSTPTASAADTPALSTPKLTAQATASGIILGWNVVAGATRYELYAGTEAAGWWEIGGDNLTGSSFTHSDVTAGTTYYYTVRAVNADGDESDWATNASATALQQHIATVTPTPTETATSTPTPTATADVSGVSDRDALVALYNATHGDNWASNANWLSQEAIGDWYGVTTDANGSVTRLMLPSNHLSGTIPAALGSLGKLEQLYLYGNSLTGRIPAELGNLGSLTILQLQVNQLSGPIPKELGNPAGLIALHLNYNKLSGVIPGELGGLGNLVRLHLNNNELSGSIPVELGNLRNLTHLTLKVNQLSGCVPSALGDVANNDLGDLGLSFCTGAPATSTPIASATSTPTATATSTPDPAASAADRAALAALYNATGGDSWTNSANWLSQKPLSTWYGVITNGNGRVSRLNLESNGLSGTVPDLSALTDLERLYLGGNSLSGQLPSLSALTKLTTLDLRQNRLSGALPDLSALTSLSWLSLADNEFSGSIPSTLSNLSNLEYMHLSTNRLSGSIPDLSALTKLKHLYLSGNSMSGSIPDLSALTELTHLFLGDNQLSGTIPDLSALTKLHYLSLSKNGLSGSIPATLGSLTNLFWLYLDDNDLSGSIPAELGNLTRLRFLHLQNNRLSGSIPDLSAITRLLTFNLSNNQLSGQVPDLSALTEIARLMLNGNQLSGTVPDLSPLANLEYLYLQDNQLSGGLLEIGVLTNLTALKLSNNQFSGPVPDLSDLTKLTVLDLSGNQLCLPSGSDVAGSNTVVSKHLNRLNLSTCTDAELAKAPGRPQNLSATVGSGQVALTWDAVTDAASYDLWTWDSLDRAWGAIGGVITGTNYTHTVQTDGRNYYYQVRARNASDQRGAWSERALAVITSQFSPPPASLGLDLKFQKHMEVSGMTVVATSDVPDEQVIQAGGIITGMLSNQSDLLTFLGEKSAQFRIDGIGAHAWRWGAKVPVVDPACGIFAHELGHLLHYYHVDGHGDSNFDTRVQSLYQSALNAGLWTGMYASTNYYEYWAEAVEAWFSGALPSNVETVGYSTLEEYDPAVAALVEEVFGDATLPASCSE